MATIRFVVKTLLPPGAEELGVHGTISIAVAQADRHHRAPYSAIYQRLLFIAAIGSLFFVWTSSAAAAKRKLSVENILQTGGFRGTVVEGSYTKSGIAASSKPNKETLARGTIKLPEGGTSPLFNGSVLGSAQNGIPVFPLDHQPLVLQDVALASTQMVQAFTSITAKKREPRDEVVQAQNALASASTHLATSTIDPTVRDDLQASIDLISGNFTNVINFIDGLPATLSREQIANLQGVIAAAHGSSQILFDQTLAAFPPNSFDVCVQDDANVANVLLVNTFTGEYLFRCGATTVSGRGTITRRGSAVTLTDNAADRRVNASVNTAVSRGTAQLQMPPGVTTCTITDRNLTDNICGPP